MFSCLLIFIENRILVNELKNPFLPTITTLTNLKLKPYTTFYDKETPIHACEPLQEPSALAQLGFALPPVKSFLWQTSSEVQQQILRAFHWVNWEQQSRYCGHCGAPLQTTAISVEKKCASCLKSHFPRFSPAVMVLVQKGPELLLARSPHFKQGFYSAIAGFLEVGETAENAAHREVKEELGIEITNLHYFGTQTWPFPDSFMIAFKADYLKGDLCLDPTEIEDAQWFHKHNLPKLPPSASISRKLIESALNEDNHL